MKKNKNLEKLKRPTTFKGWFYELIPVILLILFLTQFPRFIALVGGFIKFLNTL